MCEIRRVCGKNVLNSANRTGMPFNRKTKKERQSRILNQMILCDYIRINMDKPYMPTYIDIDPKKVPLGWSLVTANFSRFCLFLFEHFSLFSKKKALFFQKHFFLVPTCFFKIIFSDGFSEENQVIFLGSTWPVLVGGIFWIPLVIYLT